MKFKEIFLKFKEQAPKSKSGLLVVLGIIGLILILVSTFPEQKEKQKEQEAAASVDTQINRSQAYAESIEQRLESIISDMLSDSKVSVLVTLESGVEYVYAAEVKTDAESKSDKATFKEEQSDTNQNSYVIFKDSKGNEQALLVTEIMPKVKGVVVVCDNGQTENVSAAVKTAVGKALAIDVEKICVIGRH